MNIDWNTMKTQSYMSLAWRVAQQPDAIAEAVRTGEQVNDLLTHAARLVHRACRDVDPLVESASLRCQVILDRLTGQTDRLIPVLRRLRAAKAVTS